MLKYIYIYIYMYIIYFSTIMKKCNTCSHESHISRYARERRKNMCRNKAARQGGHALNANKARPQMQRSVWPHGDARLTVCRNNITNDTCLYWMLYLCMLLFIYSILFMFVWIDILFTAFNNITMKQIHNKYINDKQINK